MQRSEGMVWLVGARLDVAVIFFPVVAEQEPTRIHFTF